MVGVASCILPGDIDCCEMEPLDVSTCVGGRWTTYLLVALAGVEICSKDNNTCIRIQTHTHTHIYCTFTAHYILYMCNTCAMLSVCFVGI